MLPSIEQLLLEWKTLPKGDSSELMATRVLDEKTSEGNVRLGLTESSQLRVFFPVPPRVPLPENIRSPTIGIEDKTLDASGKAIRFLIVVCLESALERVFAEVVHEILDKLAKGHSTQSALAETINEFRRLLTRRSSRLSDELLLGVIGELYVLRKLLRADSAAAKVWVGPTGARHDFRSGDHALEIKTSLRHQQPVVEISSLVQLETPAEHGTLHLVHLILEEDPEGALTLTSLLEDCLSLAIDPGLINSRIEAAGISSDDLDDAQDRCFSFFSFHTYLVSEEFPRLVRAMVCNGTLPVGVSHVTYRIDLASVRPLALDEDAVSQLFNQFSLPKQ